MNGYMMHQMMIINQQVVGEECLLLGECILLLLGINMSGGRVRIVA